MSIYKPIAISIHTFRVEGDVSCHRKISTAIISIHTFRVEGDKNHKRVSWVDTHFNPHLPCGRWPYWYGYGHWYPPISIHTFRVEGDISIQKIQGVSENFNPHLPCGRWPKVVSAETVSAYISIHTFRVEGDYSKTIPLIVSAEISIHTFRVEGDSEYPPHYCWISLFQSTPSVWKVTLMPYGIYPFVPISIHTFRVEGDCHVIVIACGIAYFNPHLPCGRWQKSLRIQYLWCRFQSTPSVWKVTFGL